MVAKSKFYKHPAFGQVYCDEALKTPTGRLSWPSLVAPKDPPPPQDGQPPGQPRYEVTILLPKQDKFVKEFITTLEDKVTEMTPIFNNGRKGSKVSFEDAVQDGDDSEAFDPEKYPYYAGNWILTARNIKKPQVFDGKVQPFDPVSVLGGMKGKLVVTPMLHEKGVKYKLEVVQFVSDDGTRFGGGTRDMSSILDVCEEEDDSETETETPAKAAKVDPKELRARAAGAIKNKGKNAAVNLL
jgi:hypothetical protein